MPEEPLTATSDDDDRPSARIFIYMKDGTVQDSVVGDTMPKVPGLIFSVTRSRGDGGFGLDYYSFEKDALPGGSGPNPFGMTFDPSGVLAIRVGTNFARVYAAHAWHYLETINTEWDGERMPMGGTDEDEGQSL